MKQYIALSEDFTIIGNQTFLSKVDAKVYADYHKHNNYIVIEYVQ